MPTPESPNNLSEREEKIRRLIESGEAIDEPDAAMAIKEENWAAAVREYDSERQRAGIRRTLEDLDRRSREPDALSPEEQWDRYDLRFELAVIEAAREYRVSISGTAADEREYLTYQRFLDFIGNDLGEGQERLRNESAKLRLERKSRDVAERIGGERAEELLLHYRQKLKEIKDKDFGQGQ